MLTRTIAVLHNKYKTRPEPLADLSPYDHADEALNLVAGAITVLRILATEIPEMSPTAAGAPSNVARLNDLINTTSCASEAELREGHSQLSSYIDDLMSQLDAIARVLSQRGTPSDGSITNFKSHLSSVKRFVSAAAESDLDLCTE